MRELVPRDESPEQRTLRLARTDPAFRDLLAANLWGETRPDVLEPRYAWPDVTEAEREHWRAKLLQELEEDVP